MHTTESQYSPHEYRKSLLSLHISVLLFGLAAVLGQFVDAPAVIVAGGRVLCSSLLLAVVAFLSKTPLRLQQKMDYGIVSAAGVVLAVHWTTFFQSIHRSSVAIGTITFSTFPLFLTVLEPLLFREKFKARNLGTAAALLLGVFITIPEFSTENQVTVGVIWGMASSLSYALLSLANRYLSARYTASVICLYEQGTAAVLLFPALLLVKTNWTPQNLLGIAVIGFICTAFAHSL